MISIKGYIITSSVVATAAFSMATHDYFYGEERRFPMASCGGSLELVDRNWLDTYELLDSRGQEYATYLIRENAEIAFLSHNESCLSLDR